MKKNKKIKAVSEPVASKEIGLENDGDTIKKLLAEQIGVDVEEINLEDRLVDDLHLTASDLSEFVETLTKNGFDVTLLELDSLETLIDIVEPLSLQKEIE